MGKQRAYNHYPLDDIEGWQQDNGNRPGHPTIWSTNQTDQQGYGRPYQSGYGRPYQPGYGRPYQPGYGRPYQPGYGQPNQPGYGQQNQPGYDYGYWSPFPQQQQQVLQVGRGQQAAVPVIQVRPSNYLALAIITCVCFNPFCGIIAIICSEMSSRAAAKGNTEKARTRGKISCSCSIIGIITGIGAIITIIVLYVVFIDKTVKTACLYIGC